VEEKEELFQQMVQDKINLVKQMEKDLDAIRFQAHQTTAPKKHGNNNNNNQHAYASQSE
jgi:hypothetical protein